jgi:hypothetical protein
VTLEELDAMARILMHWKQVVQHHEVDVEMQPALAGGLR